jgi:uncharacterized membrane protein YeiB
VSDPDSLHADRLVSESRSRAIGFDVARAIAVLGMIMVDVRHELLSYRGMPPLLWLFDRVEGKAAALFVLLAGVGLSLRTHRPESVFDVASDRRPLLERAALLIGVGLLLMHVWKYDILHFHGVYLLLAIPLLHAHSRTLWLLAAGSMWIAMVLGHELDWELQPTLSFGGALRHVFFNGLYPVFPWVAFVLVGMAVGRLDFHDRAVRRRTLAIALLVAGVTGVLDSLGRWEQHTGALGLGGSATWLLTWPRAPRPFFVVSGCAIGVAVICTCIALTQRARGRWVQALAATGQLTLTLYVGHVLVIVLPLEHGLQRGLPIEIAFAYAVVVYVAAIAFALWWRRRWQHGPLEGLLRQVLARERPAPSAGLQVRR